jgi:iron complex outermembrane receptor protein
VAAPERLDSYEFGWKLDLLDGRVNVTGAVFFYDYDNYQLFTNNQSFGGNPEFVTINASSAENYGAEIEAMLQPWEGANLRVNFGWLESQFILFFQRRVQEFREPGSVGDAVVVSRAINNSGNRLLNSPQYTVSIVASQDFDLGRFGVVTFRYNGAWTDDVFFDATGGVGVPNGDDRDVMPANSVGQEAYWLHGVGVDWAFAERALTISGWVRNLENYAYKRLVADASAFQGTTINFVGMPRTYGLTVRYEF